MKIKLLFLFLVVFTTCVAQQQAATLSGLQSTNIASNSVTFSYSVRTNGSFTNCSVWYSLNQNWALPVIGTTPSAGFSNSASFQNGTANVGGLQPNTTYYWRVVASNSSGNADSQTLSFTTLPLPTIPTVTTISAVAASSSAVISYTLNANNGNTTSIVRFGTNSTLLPNNVAGFIATGNIALANSAVITGLTSNTQYFYQIVATNSAGTTPSAISSFTTTAYVAAVAIADYNFNNTRANIVGTEPFSAAGTSFTVSRDNVANNALSINAGTTGTSATITGLPSGNAARTISFWYKLNSNVNNSAIFSNGTTGAAQFGMYIQSTGRPVLWSDLADPVFGTASFAANSWHHAVLTHDGSNVSIYMNGILQGTKPFTASTTANSPLNFFNASTFLSIDDLKIFNIGLTQSEVSNLFTNNTLSSDTFNQNNLQVSLYPNPATDILNITMVNEVKSIEIYTIQGQKVKVANQKQINVSDLASGMYTIKIQDANDAIATKKFIKQ